MTAIKAGLDLIITDENNDEVRFERNEEGWITLVTEDNTIELSPEDQKEIERFFKG